MTTIDIAEHLERQFQYLAALDPPTPDKFLLTTLEMLDDVAPNIARHYFNTTPQMKKLSPSAKKKKRRRKLKKGSILYIWTPHGDAADHLCSRYVGTIWPDDGSAPIPGNGFSMNDSHVNCLCEMEYAGVADANTETERLDVNREDMPRAPWLDL